MKSILICVERERVRASENHSEPLKNVAGISRRYYFTNADRFRLPNNFLVRVLFVGKILLVETENKHSFFIQSYDGIKIT